AAETDARASAASTIATAPARTGPRLAIGDDEVEVAGAARQVDRLRAAVEAAVRSAGEEDARDPRTARQPEPEVEGLRRRPCGHVDRDVDGARGGCDRERQGAEARRRVADGDPPAGPEPRPRRRVRELEAVRVAGAVERRVA